MAARAAFADQARWSTELGSPFTARLCRLLAERLDRSTEAGRRVLDWPGDASGGADALPMRLLGGLHAQVRAGDAPVLAAAYPPNSTPDDESLWKALSGALRSERLAAWLDSAPQTNEVGRSAVLMAGLLAIAERHPGPMELLELGASAGLNLNLDRYGYDLGGLDAGDETSPVRLAPRWTGEPPPSADVRVASRRGVDLNPLDPARDGDRLIAYVWPDQRERLERIEAALALAAATPPRVDRGDAAEWLEKRLEEPAAPGSTRVVLHSVAFQYFPADRQARIATAIEDAGKRADAAAPLAWLRYEMVSGEGRYSLRLQLWPGGEDERLAWAHPHGSWVKWVRGR